MDTGAAEVGFAAAASHDPFKGSSFTVVSDWSYGVSRCYQHVLDHTTSHVLYWWLACLVVALVYVLRVYLVQGFYVVSYGLGIDGPSLPTHGSDEFRPFVRRLPEFKF